MNVSMQQTRSAGPLRPLAVALASASLLALAACRAEPQVRPTAGGAQPDSASAGTADSRLDPGPGGGAVEQSYDIINVIPRDGIPAIDDPQFVSAVEADEFYADDDMVIGVSVGNDHRAYSVPFLSGHEIVNDEVGGRPITVTW